MLRLAGAELIEVPAVPYKDEIITSNIPVDWRKNLPSSENGAVWANQFDNIANRQAHIETTGPEIWQQTEGRSTGLPAPLARAARWRARPSISNSKTPKSVSLPQTQWGHPCITG